MKVRLNGQETDLPDGLSLAGLLTLMKLPAEKVAIELNREIAKRSQWEVTFLKEDDKIEIVTFVGGG